MHLALQFFQVAIVLSGLGLVVAAIGSLLTRRLLPDFKTKSSGFGDTIWYLGALLLLSGVLAYVAGLAILPLLTL